MNPVGPVASLLLTPVAALYGLVVRARDRYYRRPGTAWHPGIPVISVGNLTVGGTGKTPLVAWLAEGAAGNRAKVIRSYGGTQREISVRIKDLLDKGKISANLKMLPGDVLIIPESRF